MRKVVLSVLVDNTSGVLNRVAGLFSRRSFNIDSLTVSETENPLYSRMTIVVHGDEETLEQIKKQMLKLVDVKEIKELTAGESVCRELVLVKVAVNAEERPQITAIADSFRAKIVDVAKHSMMLELTGNENKLEAFIELLNGFEILELVRTGLTGLTRGATDLKEQQ
ncbi:MAG: acetolactate synthase small subunit [Lachnospiraceae bacterium]|nr:acetolactate synthase small subunit [Lachnospiraceae bacterium]